MTGKTWHWFQQVSSQHIKSIYCTNNFKFQNFFLAHENHLLYFIYLFIYLLIYFLLTHKSKATRKLATGNSQLASDISSHYLWFLEKFVNFISTCNNFVLITILFLIQVPCWINAGKEISLRNSVNFANKLNFVFLHKMWLY